LDSTPRAYRLEVGNAAPTFSTEIGTTPPLAQYFAAQNMTGRQLTIERRADGTFGLSIR